MITDCIGETVKSIQQLKPPTRSTSLAPSLLPFRRMEPEPVVRTKGIVTPPNSKVVVSQFITSPQKKRAILLNNTLRFPRRVMTNLKTDHISLKSSQSPGPWPLSTTLPTFIGLEKSNPPTSKRGPIELSIPILPLQKVMEKKSPTEVSADKAVEKILDGRRNSESEGDAASVITSVDVLNVENSKDVSPDTLEGNSSNDDAIAKSESGLKIYQPEIGHEKNELILREKLLKAALLRKMELSHCQLNLKCSEQQLITKR